MVFVAGALGLVACSGAIAASRDGGTDAEVPDASNDGRVTTTMEAGVDAGMDGDPCSSLVTCTLQGNEYVCDCDAGSVPVCPASGGQGQACDQPNGSSCMGCGQGATFTCTCWDAGVFGAVDGGGSHWECAAPGVACP
jgi:hypothetical protein